MASRRCLLSGVAAILTAAGVAGCGQSIRGELPPTQAPLGRTLTPEETKARIAELVRDKEQRQNRDLADIQGRNLVTR